MTLARPSKLDAFSLTIHCQMIPANPLNALFSIYFFFFQITTRIRTKKQ